MRYVMNVFKKGQKALLKAVCLGMLGIVSCHAAAGQQSAGPSAGDEFVGIWQYPSSMPNRITNYLRVRKVGKGEFRLTEGIKDRENPFKDSDTIMWTEPNRFCNNGSAIKLTHDMGMLKGKFVADCFRPTHSHEFTYKVSLKLQPNGTMIYAVWSSGDGKHGDTETFEATRVGATGATKGSAKSTGETDQPIRIGVVQNTSAIGGCSCYFSAASPGARTGRDGYIFFADYAGKARMNINGQDVELREVGREQAKGELGRCSKKRCKYTASGINATVDYRETNKCPPDPTECEVTGYDVTITVEKGGLRQKVMGKGECGC
jgi:hypothetical protein